MRYRSCIDNLCSVQEEFLSEISSAFLSEKIKNGENNTLIHSTVFRSFIPQTKFWNEFMI